MLTALSSESALRDRNGAYGAVVGLEVLFTGVQFLARPFRHRRHHLVDLLLSALLCALCGLLVFTQVSTVAFWREWCVGIRSVTVAVVVCDARSMPFPPSPPPPTHPCGGRPRSVVAMAVPCHPHLASRSRWSQRWPWWVPFSGSAKCCTEPMWSCSPRSTRTLCCFSVTRTWTALRHPEQGALGVRVSALAFATRMCVSSNCIRGASVGCRVCLLQNRRGSRVKGPSGGLGSVLYLADEDVPE